MSMILPGSPTQVGTLSRGTSDFVNTVIGSGKFKQYVGYADGTVSTYSILGSIVGDNDELDGRIVHAAVFDIFNDYFFFYLAGTTYWYDHLEFIENGSVVLTLLSGDAGLRGSVDGTAYTRWDLSFTGFERDQELGFSLA